MIARRDEGRAPAPAPRQERAPRHGVADVQYGHRSPLAAPAADADRGAEGLCRGGRAGVRAL